MGSHSPLQKAVKSELGFFYEYSLLLWYSFSISQSAAHFSLKIPAVSMTISDSGPGISPELQPRLFEKFKSGKRQSSGIGLGLYLCRSIIELHQGTIRYSDAPLGGACFIVTLPLRERF
jgi:signal transduction histidine kinase